MPVCFCSATRYKREKNIRVAAFSPHQAFFKQQWGDIQGPWPFDPKEHALKKGKRNDPCRPEGQSTSNTAHNRGLISGVIRGRAWVRIRDIYLLLLQEPLWIGVPPFIIQEIGKANTFSITSERGVLRQSPKLDGVQRITGALQSTCLL